MEFFHSEAEAKKQHHIGFSTSIMFIYCMVFSFQIYPMPSTYISSNGLSRAYR